MEILLGTIKQGTEIGYRRQGKFIWAACEGCGKERWVALLKGNILKRTRCHSCASKAAGLGKNTRGANNVNWKGGKRIDQKGYVKVKIYPEDFFYSMADSWHYVAEHRLVMAKHLGRCLWDVEKVHHKNGEKADNRIENLELTTNGAHITAHHKGYKDGYSKGLIDGRDKQIEELRQEIKLLQWQIKHGMENNSSLREERTSVS